MTPDHAELRRLAEAATTPGLRDRRVAIAEYRLAACNAIPKLLDELEAAGRDRDFLNQARQQIQSMYEIAAEHDAAWKADSDRADSLAAQVVALREALKAYHPGCDAKALCAADRVLADTAAVAAEWKRRERLAGAKAYATHYGHGWCEDCERGEWLQAMEAEASQEGTE